MDRRLILAAAFVLSIVRTAPAEDRTRIFLLGGANKSAADAPEGLGYADWLRVFLEPKVGNLEISGFDPPPGTARQAREEAQKPFTPAPDVFVVDLGIDDALKTEPAEFLREFEGLLDGLAKDRPAVKVLLVTSAPLDARHPRSGDEKFLSAGGIDAYLRDHFVEPVRTLARERKIALADHHAIVHEALRAGEKPEALTGGGGRPTVRGTILLARSTALSVLFVLGRRSAPPSLADVLQEGDILILPPPPPEVGPVLEVWTKDLEPIWADRLKDDDPAVRLNALSQLTAAGTIPPRFLDILLGFLDPTSTGRDDRNEVQQILSLALDSGLLARDSALAALLARIRAVGPSSPMASRIFPILTAIAAGPSPGQPRAARPPSRPLRSVTVPPQRPGAALPSERPAVTFSAEDIDLFASVLAARDDGIRQSAHSLLVAAGEAGIGRLLAEARKLPDGASTEILDRLWQNKPARSGVVLETFLKMARGEPREEVRTFCIDRVLGLPASEVPLDLLKRLFEGETGTVQLRAAQILAGRGQEGFEVLLPSLQAAEEDRVRLSRTALLYIGLHGEADLLPTRALAALLDHFTSALQGEFLYYLDTVLEKRTPPLTCIPEPDQGPVRLLSKKTVAAARIPPRSVRQVQPGNWPVETKIARVDRLKDFLPRIEKSLREGTDDEKGAAEKILQQLWLKAREIEAAAARTEVRAVLPPRLEKEAWDSLKAGDAKAFLEKARQSVAAGAGPSILNRFAWKLATSSREAVRRPAEAERWALDAIDKGRRTPAHLETLAASLAAQGKFKEALELELEALLGLPKEENPAPLLARAVLYLNGRPYVEPEAR